MTVCPPVLESGSFSSQPILLPAVLQADGEAPCFGTISGISEHGLAFNVQGSSLGQKNVGRIAKLDFDLMGLHHSCKGLIVHVQNTRALLSLRETATNVRAALQSINQDSLPTLASRLSIQQAQQACHAHFMQVMKRVLARFHETLPAAIAARLGAGEAAPGPLALLGPAIESLRPVFVRHFTLAYPMYPEQLDVPLQAAPEHQDDPADMARVDEWIRRTTLAQEIIKTLDALPETFSRQYSGLLNTVHKRIPHPYHPDAVLQLLSGMIEPLRLDTEARILCYEVMGQAFAAEAPALYADMLRIVRQAPTRVPAHQDLSLEQWLRRAADKPADVAPVDGHPLQELTALLERLVASLEAGAGESRAAWQGTPLAEPGEIPGLLARDRIFSRFLPARAGLDTGGMAFQHAPALLESDPSAAGVGHAPDSMADLDQAAMQGLIAAMRQQSPIDLAPDKPPRDSQVRGLMLQAQGLLLEYTLNGLTYQSHPEHPAWILLNALDALHLGADPQGRLLDPALYQALALTMQWLLGQSDIDAALQQVNALLAPIARQLGEQRQQRRARQFEALGPLSFDTLPFGSRWCLVRRDDDAIPYEILGQRGGNWACIDRAATELITLTADHFFEQIDRGLIEETCSFDQPFLARIADATLAAGLHAVHAYTWQDPASGCLKRSALIDELERRLAHPVTEPPLFCALIEIPTLRPGHADLTGDELAVLQKRTGERLLAALESGEHCGRLSDVSFLMIFAPQDPQRLVARLAQLRTEMEALHPVWKMTGAVVPLADGETGQAPSHTLRRANLACVPARQAATFDLSCLSGDAAPSDRIESLPFSALYLRCQKIAACAGQAPAHYEILLGIDDDLRPRHTPQSLVIMAEQTGLAHDLDAWVLRSALEWMDRRAGELDQLSGLSVNLSGNSLTAEGHIDTMLGLLARFPHLAHKLILEVTETAAIDNLDLAVRSLRQLRQLGCRIALDDFGSGYSSYSYIRRLPLDYLKIDGTYIRNLLTDPTDQALTASMVDVAHALGLKVIAEYVDSEAVHAWLHNLGVDYVQGYWVHAPERLDDLVLTGPA